MTKPQSTARKNNKRRRPSYRPKPRDEIARNMSAIRSVANKTGPPAPFARIALPQVCQHSWETRPRISHRACCGIRRWGLLARATSCRARPARATCLPSPFEADRSTVLDDKVYEACSTRRGCDVNSAVGGLVCYPTLGVGCEARHRPSCDQNRAQSGTAPCRRL
jgi:hypothetical protein